MSQNKTRILGGDIDTQQLYPQNGVDKDPMANFYRQNTNTQASTSANTSCKTIIGGTFDDITDQNQATQAQVSQPAPKPLSQKAEKPKPTPQRHIVGLLFSVSKTEMGEIIPIYLGRNVIGRDASCDICLEEESVSDTHAIIVARQLTGNRPMIVVSLTDKDSSYGTYLSNELIDYDTHIVENGDHIRFGQAYEFVFIKLDATNLGLNKANNFYSASATKLASSESGNNPYAPTNGKNNSNRTMIYNNKR